MFEHCRNNPFLLVRQMAQQEHVQPVGGVGVAIGGVAAGIGRAGQRGEQGAGAVERRDQCDMDDMVVALLVLARPDRSPTVADRFRTRG